MKPKGSLETSNKRGVRKDILELMAVKSNVILDPSTVGDLQKATILFKCISSALLPSFTNTDTGTQYEQPQQQNISKLMTIGNYM